MAWTEPMLRLQVVVSLKSLISVVTASLVQEALSHRVDRHRSFEVVVEKVETVVVVE